MDPSVEKPLIRKDAFVLTNERFKTPKTSMLAFHFEPKLYRSTSARLKESAIEHFSIEGKDVYLIDQFFPENEAKSLREYSSQATFSRSSYASHESREQGEEPALSMNNKEKWEFFAHPPEAIQEIFKLLGFLSQQLEADISTLPWDLCEQSICASAVATNRIERVSHESMELGKHEDFNTERGVPFGIPVLYAKDLQYYDSQFTNGDIGKPLLISVMIYATSDDFKPEYGMGTVYYKSDGEQVLQTDCKHMRIVIFEGDIVHSIQESLLPAEIKVWRISYVFKLIVNPKKEKHSVRSALHELLSKH